MGKPIVSVVLPVYNAAPYVEEAVRSMLAQTVPDIEIVAIDDGSTDDSRARLQRLERLDGRVRVVSNLENMGIVASRNRGLAEARARWIATMDADDLSAPTRLEVQLDYLKSRRAIKAVGCKVQFVGARRGLWRQPTGVAGVARRLPFSNPLVHSATLMDGAWLCEQTLRYDPSFPLAEDYDLWERMVARGAQIDNIPKLLHLYRVHGTSTTSTSLRRMELLANVVRARCLARLGCALSEEERVFMDTRQFEDWRPLSTADLELLQRLCRKLQRQLDRAPGDAYERGRFLASLLPRPKSMSERLAIALDMIKVDSAAALKFLGRRAIEFN